MAHEKPAIVIADCEPAIVSALYNFAYLTLQRHLGFPCETFSDQSDSIANFETIFQVRLSLPLHSRTIAARVTPQRNSPVKLNGGVLS